jgi:hypothetical protein
MTKNRHFIFALCVLLISFNPCLAEPSNDDLRALMLIGNVEAVITTVEKDRAINWSKNKLKINPIASEYYAIALIVYGDINKANLFLEAAMEHHPKSQKLKDCKKHLDFFANHFINQDLNYNKPEKIHIKIYDLFHLYLSEPTDSKTALKLKKKIIKEINKLGSPIPYFMTALDYLAELNDPSLNQQIETRAFAIIQNKRKQLFPKTMDFYQLALAYKNLARLSAQTGEVAKATQYIKLAQSNVFKMKALWLKEDIRHYRKIMKMEQRVTEFGYVLPQWLILLRDEYQAYLRT